MPHGSHDQAWYTPIWSTVSGFIDPRYSRSTFVYCLTSHWYYDHMLKDDQDRSALNLCLRRWQTRNLRPWHRLRTHSKPDRFNADRRGASAHDIGWECTQHWMDSTPTDEEPIGARATNIVLFLVERPQPTRLHRKGDFELDKILITSPLSDGKRLPFSLSHIVFTTIS